MKTVGHAASLAAAFGMAAMPALAAPENVATASSTSAGVGSPATAPAAAPSPAVSPVAIAAPATPPVAPAAPNLSLAHVPEGTELALTIDDHLSSATAAAGDRFSVTLDEPVKLDDGVVIPAGYHGIGEVTASERNGMVGKAGYINVRIDYLSIGDTRVRLRASKATEGKDAVTTTVVVSVLFGVFGLLVRGKNAEIAHGTRVTAYVDDPIDLPLPLARPKV